MFRRYDWECQVCGAWFERLVKFPQGDPAPKTLGEVEDEDLECPKCTGDASTAERLISCPAEYHGERDLSPRVFGGRFDTMGQKQVERPKEVGFMPTRASYEEARNFVNRPIYKEWRAEKQAVRKENKAKRARAAAKERGETINFRRDKLPGDPKIAS